MTDEQEARRERLRRISSLQKQHEDVRSMMRRLEEKQKLTSGEERELSGLQARLDGLEYAMDQESEEM